MLNNYLTIAWRNLSRRKVYALINILGLAIGLACVILIALFVRKEVSYDTFHENAEQLVRLHHIYSFVHGPWGPTMVQDYPEVLSATRLSRSTNRKVHLDDREEFYETIYLAEANFFDLFTFPFINGNPETALTRPDALVLTETTAKRYFGTIDVVGRTVETYNLAGHDTLLLNVTGVIEDVPTHSHFQFDQLASFQLFERGPNQALLNDWYNDWAFTYLLLQEGADYKALNAKMPAFFTRHKGEPYSPGSYIQPLLDIRLHSTDLRIDIEPQGDINHVRIFSAIALLILIIACINFVNLATARASQRAKEVGIRKVVGAQQRQLIGQFLGESLLMVMVSILLALGLVALIQPFFQGMMGIDVGLAREDYGLMVLLLLGLTAFVGLLAGSYPAFVLSRFQPVRTLKGKADGGRRHARFRTGLVVFQFCISIVLIVGTLVVANQMGFMKNKALGFDAEQVLFINYGSSLNEDLPLLRQQLGQHPNILQVSSTSAIMGNVAFNWQFRFEGADQEPTGDEWAQFGVGVDFIESLAIDVVKGRTFSDAFPTDSTAFLLNERGVKEAVARYGDQWQHPIGRTIEFLRVQDGTLQLLKSGPVIGVVKDFHVRSVQHQIQPLIIHYHPDWIWRLVLRLRSENVSETLAYLEQQWQTWERDRPFNYEFLDDRFAANYEGEARFSRLLLIFCVLAIFIACLGLFGLASFTAQQHVKEIGIRKVLGASTSDMVVFFLRAFLKPVILAFLVSVPLAYVAMSQWLDGFAYRTPIGVDVFVIAGILALLIALATISHRTMQAARGNPVEALRYE